VTTNIPISSADFSRSFEDENNEIIELSLKFAHKANEGHQGSRLATDGVILQVALRAIDEAANQAFSVRKHKVMTEVSHFMALLQKDKVITASAKNTDLLPIAHPRSSQMHMFDIQTLLAARARWIADDPSIKDDEVRAMVASMLMAPEDSPERQYYIARLENLPQGQVPVRALVAAFKLGANKGFWRFQRRDRKGRFAWMGGGVSAPVRGEDGVVRRLSGRTVSAGVGPGAQNDYFDLEYSPGKIARVPAKAAEASKAYLPSPDAKDGLSPVKARVKSGDLVLDAKDVEYPDAPSGFTKVEGKKEASSKPKAQADAPKWKDRFGRSIPLGRPVNFKLKNAKGADTDVYGEFVGDSDREGYGRVRVEKNTFFPDGIYEVSSDNGAEFLPSYKPEYLESVGFKQGFNDAGEAVPARTSDQVPRLEDVVREDLEGVDESKRPDYEGWERADLSKEIDEFVESQRSDILARERGAGRGGGLDDDDEMPAPKGTPEERTEAALSDLRSSLKKFYEDENWVYTKGDNQFVVNKRLAQRDPEYAKEIADSANLLIENQPVPGGVSIYATPGLKAKVNVFGAVNTFAAGDASRTRLKALGRPTSINMYYRDSLNFRGLDNPLDVMGERLYVPFAYERMGASGRKRATATVAHEWGHARDFNLGEEGWGYSRKMKRLIQASPKYLDGVGWYGRTNTAEVVAEYYSQYIGEKYYGAKPIGIPQPIIDLFESNLEVSDSEPSTEEKREIKKYSLPANEQYTVDGARREGVEDRYADRVPAKVSPSEEVESPEEVEYYGEDADFGEFFSDGNYQIRKFDIAQNSPIALDNFRLAKEAQAACGVVAAADGDSCPISVDGAGPNGELDPAKPVLFTSRSEDPQNPDVFSVTQSWADAMRDLRQDEKRYLKNEPPAPNKKTGIQDANSEQDWEQATEDQPVEAERLSPQEPPVVVPPTPSTTGTKDRFGVSLQQGNGVVFSALDERGSKREIVGEYVGPSRQRGFSRVRIQGVYRVEDGIYDVPTENLEELSKYARPEIAQGLGLQPGRGTEGQEISDIPRDQLPTLDSLSREDLEGYDESSRSLYDGWNPVDPSEVEKNLDAFVERNRESVLNDERDITHRWRAANDPTYERYGEDSRGSAFSRVVKPEFEPEGTPEERTEKVLEKMKQDLVKRFVEPNYFYTSEDGKNQLVVDKRAAEKDPKRAKEAADSFLLLSSNEPVEGGVTLWYSGKSQWTNEGEAFFPAAGLAYHAPPNQAIFKSRFIEISGRESVFNIPDRSLLDSSERVLVPAGQEMKDSVSSVVAHEYGHIKDFSAGDEGMEITSDLLELFRSDPSKMDLLGSYGRSAPVEATAEFFSQYYLEKYFGADEAGIPEEVRAILEKDRSQNRGTVARDRYSSFESFDLPENDLYDADGSPKDDRRTPSFIPRQREEEIRKALEEERALEEEAARKRFDEREDPFAERKSPEAEQAERAPAGSRIVVPGAPGIGGPEGRDQVWVKQEDGTWIDESGQVVGGLSSEEAAKRFLESPRKLRILRPSSRREGAPSRGRVDKDGFLVDEILPFDGRGRRRPDGSREFGPPPGLRIPLPGPWNPRIPGTGRKYRPRPRKYPGRGPWGTAGPSVGHAPYPVPGRRVYPGEIADMRIGSEIEALLGGIFSRYLKNSPTLQLRKTGANEWTNLDTGEKYTNQEVSEIAATSGKNQSPFYGLATGPEVRVGRFVGTVSRSLFKEMPIGTELKDNLRVFDFGGAQFRKIGYNQWRRWDGKIFTDEQVQNKSASLQFDRIGEFGPGTPPADEQEAAGAGVGRPLLPRGPLTAAELAEAAVGAIVSKEDENGNKVFYEKTGEDSWRQLDVDTDLPNPLFAITNEDLLQDGKDITLEAEPDFTSQPQEGMSPADLTPEALENLPEGTVVGIPEEVIERYMPPRGEVQSDKDYENAVQAAKDYFRRARWRKIGPNEWVNEFGETATDAEIADIDKNPGRILELGKDYSVPDAYYNVNREELYTPQGGAEGQTSSDFTDDPTELAQRFSEEELKISLQEALQNPNGYGNLPFEGGDEPLPAEALYQALVNKIGREKADDFVKRIYAEGREFDAKRELFREFPGINSSNPEERKAALIEAWNSQWGRAKFSVDENENISFTGEDNDTVAAKYLLEEIKKEEWGEEFLNTFNEEYSEVLKSKSYEGLRPLFRRYPDLLSDEPNAQEDAVLRALDDLISEEEYVTDEKGNITEVTPKTLFTKYLWELAQKYIKKLGAPVARKDGDADLEELPPLLQGLTEDELEKYRSSGDYSEFLPNNPETFANVWNQYYQPFPERYDSSDGPDEVAPLNLARRFTTEQLQEQLKYAILEGEGNGIVSFESPSGEPVEFQVSAEALRDAIQLRGDNANDFIQQIYDDNPSPARRLKKLIDEINELEAQYDASTDPKERRSLRNKIERRYSSIGEYAAAINDYKKREVALNRLSRRRGLSDEQRESVIQKLANVRARRESFEEILRGDIERGQDITPFEEDTVSDLSKFDFERQRVEKPAAVAPDVEVEEVPPPATNVANPAEGFKSPSKRSVIEAIERRSRAIQNYVQTTLAPRLREDNPDPEDREKAIRANTRSEKIRRKLSNRVSRHRQEPEIGVDPRDSRIVNIRPIDFRPGDVIFDDHFTITKVEAGEVNEDKASPYYGEREIVYSGYYPGGSEQEKRLPENFRSQAVYRGVEAPEAGNLPELHAPESKDYLPEELRERAGEFLEQVRRDPVDGRTRRALYAPKERDFPEAHQKYLEDYEKYEDELAKRRAAWTPEGGEANIGEPEETPSSLQVSSVKADQLRPGDITFRENPDGTREFFVVQKVETKQVQTGVTSRTEEGGAAYPDAEAFKADAIERYPEIDEDNLSNRKRAYARLVGEYYREAQAEGQAKKTGNEYEALEGPLGDRFGWLLSQKDRILSGEKLSTESGEAREVEEPVFKTKTVVTGYHPGHQVQEKAWNPDTPISIVRGESNLPPSGDKDPVPGTSELDRNAPGYQERLAQRAEALRESSSLYPVNPSVFEEGSAQEAPKKPNAWNLIARFIPAFYGKKVLDLVRGKSGPEIKEELKKKRLVYFDFETVGNGFDRKNPDAPIQVAAVVRQNGKEVDRIVLYVNPGGKLGGFYYNSYDKSELKDLPEGTQVGQLIDNNLVTYTKKSGKWVNDADENDSLNNIQLPSRSNVLILNSENQPTLREDRLRDPDGNPITDEFLATQPGIEEQLRRLVEFFGDDAYLVAFNADFDANLLDSWARKLGIDYQTDGFIDPLPMARSLSGERGNTLSEVASRYGIIRDPDDWHNAEIDTEVLPELLDKILDDLQPGNPMLDADSRSAEYDNGKKKYDTDLSRYEDFIGGTREVVAPAPEAPQAEERPSAAPADQEIGDLLVGNDSRSFLGDVVDEAWAEDDQNTKVVRRGIARVSELRLGDFFLDKNGERNEIFEIARDPLNKERLAILYRNLRTGNLFRNFSQIGSDLEIGAPEAPIRRRVELDGLSNAQIFELARNNRRKKLGLQLPSIEPQDPTNKQAASAIDEFIDRTLSSGSASDNIPVRETTEFHFDKNGYALAEGDRVYDPKTGNSGEIIRLFPSFGTHDARDYVRFMADGQSRGQATPAPAKRFELINPPATETALSPLAEFETDIALTKEDGRVTDPISIARKIDRLSPYLNPGPGYIPAVGNALKAALRAYRNNDFALAERAASAAEDYARSLETPRRTVEDIKEETTRRMSGLSGVVGLPETGEQVKTAYSKALDSYNRGRFALARRQLDRVEDLLWDEAEKARLSDGQASPDQIKKFVEGVDDLESGIDAPLSRSYFAKVLQLARRKDYDFENKEQIIAEALEAISNGFIIPGYQVLERLARARERQLDQKDPERKKLGEESYAARLAAEVIEEDAGKVTQSMDDAAKETDPRAAAEERIRKAREGRRGLFYTPASEIRPQDIIGTPSGPATVVKIKENKDGDLVFYVREAFSPEGYSRPEVFKKDQEVLLHLRPRPAGKDVPLPQEARKLGLALPFTEGYNEFEGFTGNPVIDEDESATPQKIAMAVPKTPEAEKVSATTEQASIIDAVLSKVKRIKVLAFAGSGKTTTLRMTAEAILKKDPKAKILMVMFNKSLKDETSAKMPKGVEVRTSGSLAFQSLDNSLKSKLSDQSNTKKYPNMANTVRQVAKELDIQGAKKLTINGEEQEIGAGGQVRLIRKAVTKYSYSADDVLGPQHFDESIENVPDELIELARLYFQKATAADGNIRLKHEHIVKLWATSNPDLTKFGSGVYTPGASYLFFDEAQDINPVIEKIMTDQANFDSMIWVGDSRQAIYQFMGAVDALKRFVSDRTLTLTESFRFGPQIAGIANRFLALNGEDRRVKGSGPEGEIVDGMGSDPSIPDPDVIISRTNPGGLFLLKKFLENGKNVAIDEATLLEYESLLSGISWLRRRNSDPGSARPGDIHPELASYEDYSELLAEKKEGLLGGGPSAMLNVLQQFKESENDIGDLRDLLSRLTVVRDIPSAKKSEDYKELSYDDIESGKFGIFNEESEESLRGNADAFFWIDDDGSVNARVFRKSRRQGSFGELKAIHTYLKSLGFKWDNEAEINPNIAASDRKLFVPAEGIGAWVMPAGSALNPDENGRWELVNQIRRYANNYFQTPTTPVSFTTAHKAKGREWGRVLIAEDFKGPELNEETLEWQLPPEEELNLMYVAVTRAQTALDPGSLNWIYDETTDDDEVYRQPTDAENKIGMAVPRRTVSKVRFVDLVNESDAALTEETSRVLEELKKAVALDNSPSWVEPWKSNNLPTSFTTKTPYSGTNLIYLQAVAKNNGWKDSRWITAGEVSRQGGRVRSGETPTKMTAWLPNYQTVVDDDGAPIQTVYSVSPVSHSVYNVEQVDGLYLGTPETQEKNSPSEAEQAISRLYLDMPRIVNTRTTPEEEASGEPQAYYFTSENTIYLPPREDFSSPEKYFEALAHELIHSTGDRQRLNRETVVPPKDITPAQRNENQIEEELIAQIGTAILASRLGVELDLPNVAAYMKAWEGVYGENPDRLARAARRAQAAADYILRGRDPGQSPSELLEPELAERRIAMAVPSENVSESQFVGEVQSVKSVTDELAEQVTQMILEAIEKGETLPWRKPWSDKNIFSMPYSVTSNKPYKGGNIMMLWVTSALKGYQDNRWITFNEAKKRGGFVKKGEKGTKIVNWSPVFKDVKKEDGTTDREVIFMKPTVHTVFNVEQTEGVNLPEPELFDPIPVSEAEKIVLERYKDAPPINFTLQDKAYWSPSSDEISMPLREQFESEGEFLETLFHELTHSTGHQDRLDRKDLSDRYATHRDARGEEELIAELGAALLAARLNVNLDLVQIASYAQSWLTPLQNDTSMILKAAQKAQAAVDYMLGEGSAEPNLGESGKTGEERAAEILDQRLGIETPVAYLGEYGQTAEELLEAEKKEDF
jgi:antirestriction protein ArdC/DNA polymerase III epsilon subunit-like protein